MKTNWKQDDFFSFHPIWAQQACGMTVVIPRPIWVTERWEIQAVLPSSANIRPRINFMMFWRKGMNPCAWRIRRDGRRNPFHGLKLRHERQTDTDVSSRWHSWRYGYFSFCTPNQKKKNERCFFSDWIVIQSFHAMKAKNVRNGQIRASLAERYIYTQKGVDMASRPFLCVLRDFCFFYMHFRAPQNAFWAQNQKKPNDAFLAIELQN